MLLLHRDIVLLPAAVTDAGQRLRRLHEKGTDPVSYLFLSSPGPQEKRAKAAPPTSTFPAWEHCAGRQ